MPEELDIEQPAALLAYLTSTGRLSPADQPDVKVLSGGVSNRTVLLSFATGGAWVLKQALPKLRVSEAWFSDPARVQLEALGLRWFHQLAPSGSVPEFLFEDRAHHLLAMQAVPRPHENWKQRLLRGLVEKARVQEFGGWLGTVHRHSRERLSTLLPIFADRTFFQTLRLDPYYRVAAARNPPAAGFFADLLADTQATQECLVHGDYSPKNVLLRPEGLVVLDFEVTHFGDPAFDAGFALTHLLSKAHHLADFRSRFLAAAGEFWVAYEAALGGGFDRCGLQGRTVRHALGCLLARVDGRSPLEYLSPAERERQRGMVRRLMAGPPGSVPELVDSFSALLASSP